MGTERFQLAEEFISAARRERGEEREMKGFQNIFQDCIIIVDDDDTKRFIRAPS